MAACTVLGVGSERLLLGQGAGPYQASPGFNWSCWTQTNILFISLFLRGLQEHAA